MKRIISVILAAVLIVTVFAGCAAKKSYNINKAKVILPEASRSEQVMNLTTALAVNTYLGARASLDLFFETGNETRISLGDADDMKEYLQEAIIGFERVEKLSAAMENAVAAWEKEPASQKPKLENINSRISLPFELTANAAEASPAEKWAKDIVDKYDKAPQGKGIRTLAAHLETDAKRAFMQLQQALAILEGADYKEIADKANQAVQVASGLKAAGTGAGLVIAIASAPAAGTLGAIAKTGGVACYGVNTLLEIGSAGALIYNNGEENYVTTACDKTEAQFAPIGQVFSLMGLGYAVKDIGKAGIKAIQNGPLTAKEANDIGEATFSVLSYGGASYADYANSGALLSGTLTKSENGLEFTLMDTLTGKESEKQDSAKEVLKEAGFDPVEVNEALKRDNYVKPDGNIPKEIAEEIEDDNEFLLDEDFDVEIFLDVLAEYLKELDEQEN